MTEQPIPDRYKQMACDLANAEAGEKRWIVPDLHNLSFGPILKALARKLMADDEAELRKQAAEIVIEHYRSKGQSAERLLYHGQHSNDVDLAIRCIRHGQENPRG